MPSTLVLPNQVLPSPGTAQVEAGYRTSAGIACNKMLAKLVSGLHKPDDQTVLPPPEAARFVAPLPPRALPGIGESSSVMVAESGESRALRMCEKTSWCWEGGCYMRVCCMNARGGKFDCEAV